MRQSGADHGLSRLLHSRPRLRDNSESRILTLMTKAGFADAKKVDSGPFFSLDLGMPGIFSHLRPAPIAQTAAATGIVVASKIR